MNQTITKLWYGNLSPCEHCGVRDQEADHLLSLMERNREALCDGLTEHQRTSLEKYIACSDEYLCRMQELSFCEGFSLGCRLTAEALIKE